jgi:hypothetical protein
VLPPHSPKHIADPSVLPSPLDGNPPLLSSPLPSTPRPRQGRSPLAGKAREPLPRELLPPILEPPRLRYRTRLCPNDIGGRPGGPNNVSPLHLSWAVICCVARASAMPLSPSRIAAGAARCDAAAVPRCAAGVGSQGAPVATGPPLRRRICGNAESPCGRGVRTAHRVSGRPRGGVLRRGGPGARRG